MARYGRERPVRCRYARGETPGRLPRGVGDAEACRYRHVTSTRRWLTAAFLAGEPLKTLAYSSL